MPAGRYDLVAEVVPRPVSDEADQPFARPRAIGHAAIEFGADRAHHLQIAARLAGADRVGQVRRLLGVDGYQVVNGGLVATTTARAVTAGPRSVVTRAGVPPSMLAAWVPV